MSSIRNFVSELDLRYGLPVRQVAEDQQTSFRSWLWAIARNQVRLFYRQRGETPQAQGGTDVARRFNEYPDWIDDEEEPVSQGAVRQAKYRVLCRLREEMGG